MAPTELRSSDRRPRRWRWFAGAISSLALSLTLASVAPGQEVERWRLEGITSALDDAYPGVHAEAFGEASRLLSAPNVSASTVIQERAERTIQSAYASTIDSGAGSPDAAIAAASRLIGAAGWCSEPNQLRLRGHFSSGNTLVAQAAIEAFCACGGTLTAEAWTDLANGRKNQLLAVLTCPLPEAAPTAGTAPLPLLTFLQHDNRAIRFAAARAVQRGVGDPKPYLDAIDAILDSVASGDRPMHVLEVLLALRPPTGSELVDVLAWTEQPDETVTLLGESGVRLVHDDQERLASKALAATPGVGLSPIFRKASLTAVARLGDPARCATDIDTQCYALLQDVLDARVADPDQPLEAGLGVLEAADEQGEYIAPWAEALEGILGRFPSPSFDAISASASLLWSCCEPEARALVRGSAPGNGTAPWQDEDFTKAAVCGSGRNLPRQALVVAMLQWSARVDWSGTDLARLARDCRGDLSDGDSATSIYLRILDEARRRAVDDPDLQAVSLLDLSASEKVRKAASSRLRMGPYLARNGQLALILSPAFGAIDTPFGGDNQAAAQLYSLRFLAHYLSAGRAEARSLLDQVALHEELGSVVTARAGEQFLRGNDLVPLLVGILAQAHTAPEFSNHLGPHIVANLDRGGGWDAWDGDVRERLTAQIERLPPDAPVDRLQTALRDAKDAHSWQDDISNTLRELVLNPVKPLLALATALVALFGYVRVYRNPAVATAWRRWLERFKEERPFLGHGLEAVTLQGRLLGAGRARREAAARLVSQQDSTRSPVRSSSLGRVVTLEGHERPVTTLLESLRRPLLIEGPAASGLTSLVHVGREAAQDGGCVRLIVHAREIDESSESPLRALVERRLTEKWKIWTGDLLEQRELEIFVDAVEVLHPKARQSLLTELKHHGEWRAALLTHTGVFSESEARGIRIDRAFLQPIVGRYAKTFLMSELGTELDDQTAFDRIDASPLASRIVSEGPLREDDEEVAACGTPVELRSIAQMLVAGRSPSTLSDVLAFQLDEHLGVENRDRAYRKKLGNIVQLRCQHSDRWLDIEDNHRGALDRLERAHFVTFRHLGRSLGWSFRHQGYLELLARALRGRSRR